MGEGGVEGATRPPPCARVEVYGGLPSSRRWGQGYGVGFKGRG